MVEKILFYSIPKLFVYSSFIVLISFRALS